MRIRIAILVALGTILPTQVSFSDTVNSTKIKTFVKGQAAVAAEVNGNFTETTRAINDNFSKLQSIGGDGSGNVLSISNDRDWSSKNVNGLSESPRNFNWSSCNITGALTLTVPSGTTLRCKSGFTLSTDSTIVVKSGYGPGVASSQPTVGFTDVPGLGGNAAYEAVIRSSMNSIPLGGSGINSGGYLRIQSDGPIDIQGTISANGNAGLFNSVSGGGGGAGGIIILQSTNSILISGTVQANGGKGAIGKYLNGKTLGPSGGGGGGIIALVAPDINLSSGTSTSVKPGTVGGFTTVLVNTPLFGAGGFASGGKGGIGGNESDILGTRPAGLGESGLIIQMIGNPASMVP